MRAHICDWLAFCIVGVLFASASAGVVHVQEASVVDQDELKGVAYSRNILINGPSVSRCRECRCNLGKDQGRPLFLAEEQEGCGQSDVSTIALMRRPRYLQGCIRDQPCCDCQACRDSSPKRRLGEPLSNVVGFCRSACSKCADEAAAPVAEAPEIQKQFGIVHSRTVTYMDSVKPAPSMRPSLRIRGLPKDTNQATTVEEARAVPEAAPEKRTAQSEVKLPPPPPPMPVGMEAPPELPKGILEKIAAESDDKPHAQVVPSRHEAADDKIAKQVAGDEVVVEGHRKIHVPVAPQEWGLEYDYDCVEEEAEGLDSPDCVPKASAGKVVSKPDVEAQPLAPQQVPLKVASEPVSTAQPPVAPEKLQAEAAPENVIVESDVKTKLPTVPETLEAEIAPEIAKADALASEIVAESDAKTKNPLVSERLEVGEAPKATVDSNAKPQPPETPEAVTVVRKAVEPDMKTRSPLAPETSKAEPVRRRTLAKADIKSQPPFAPEPVARKDVAEPDVKATDLFVPERSEANAVPTATADSNVKVPPAEMPEAVPVARKVDMKTIPTLAPDTSLAEPVSRKALAKASIKSQLPLVPEEIQATAASVPEKDVVQSDVKMPPPPPKSKEARSSSVKEWEEQYDRNEASASYQRICEDADATKKIHLGDSIKFQSACAMHFVGKGRAWYCACEGKQEDACEKLKSLLKIPVLEELANVSRTDTADLISGSPKKGWFCSSPQELGAMGQKLFTDSMEIITSAAPLMAQQWAETRLKELSSSTANLANDEVRGLSEYELSNLTSALVKARGAETMPAASGLLSFRGREASSERSSVFERMANVTGLPLGCVKARRHCERSLKCRNMSLAVMEEPKDIISLVSKNCNDKGTLSGVMRVLYECPGTTLRETVVKAFSEFSEVDDDNACPVVAAISEELTTQLLPTLFALPSPTSMLSLQCVQAQQDCGKDFLCSAVITRSASLTHSLMMHETLKLCTRKVSMLRALTVAVECPGPFPSAEARIIRHELTNVDSHKMCYRAVQLLPAIPSHYTGGQPLSAECLEAHRKCGAEPSCSHAMDQMVRFSKSVPRMLDEALAVCDEGNNTLMALEVSYKCPGMIPQKEARESHDALALLPESQRCGKMKELFQVMSIMLSPLPSPACRNAKIQCRTNNRCAAIQKESFGDEQEMTEEAMNACDDKPTMMSVLHFGAECEQYPQVLRQARTALAKVSPEKMCAEAKSFMFKLGPDAFVRDVSLSMSPKIAPVACTMAHQRCGGSDRCSFVAHRIGNASMKEQMMEVVKLCGNRNEFLAALDIATECPGNRVERQMRDLKLALQDTLESDLCAEATQEIRKAIFDSVPLVLPSLSCIRAHTACSLDAKCKSTLQNGSATISLEQDMLGLCGSRFSFLRAMQVAVECPGPQSQDELRRSVSTLATTSEQELCQLAGEVLKRKDTSHARAKSLPLDALFSEAVKSEVASLSLQHARDIIAAFDVAPHDQKLNALELRALLAEAALQEAPESARAMQSTLPEVLRKFDMKALDSNGDYLVEPSELAIELSSVYAPSVERMAFVQSPTVES